MRVPLALLLAAGTLLPGCVGSALATAMETRDAADEAARLWDADARLAGALGVEGTLPLARFGVALLAGEDALPEGTADARVGDGRAEAWAYRYVAAGRDEAYVVTIDATGALRRAAPEPLRRGEAPLEAWALDSDAALEMAREENQGIRAGVEATRYGVLSVLTTEDERPVWILVGGGRGDEGRGGGIVKLDARTGETLESLGSFSS